MKTLLPALLVMAQAAGAWADPIFAEKTVSGSWRGAAPSVIQKFTLDSKISLDALAAPFASQSAPWAALVTTFARDRAMLARDRTIWTIAHRPAS
jgi:hypothetical protein